MEIRVLGGLAARLGAVDLPLGTPKQQLVFALLVARANRLVTVHDLVDELWPDAPPRSAIANVRTYAANLRRSLGSGADDEARIVREPGGYRLLIDEKLIDLHRLNVRSRRARELMREGRSAQAVPVLVEVVGAAAPLLAGLALGPGTHRSARGRESGTTGGAGTVDRGISRPRAPRISGVVTA